MPSLNELLYDIRRIAEHREKLTNKKIDKMYKQLIKDIDKFLAGTYKKYADEDGRLFLQYLDSINQRANFLNEISDNASHLSNDVKDMINEYVGKTYDKSYSEMSKAFSNAEKNGRFAEAVKDIKVQPDVLRSALNNDIGKLKLNTALESYRTSITYQIQQVLNIGLMQGMRYEKMAKAITERVGVSRNRAMNIVRTETHRNVESGFMDCAKDISSKLDGRGLVYAVTWQTMMDERVRPLKGGVANHVMMNGKTVKVGDRFVLSDGSTTEYPGGSGVASQDCRCRCFLEYNLMTEAEFARKTGIIKENNIDKSSDNGIIKYETSKSMTRIYGEKHGKAVQDILNQPNTDTNGKVKEMWYRTENKFNGRKSRYATKGTYYDPFTKKVTLDIEEIAKGTGDKLPYESLFHEYGHAIDYLSAEKFGVEKKSISMIYQGMENGKPIIDKTRKGLLGRTAKQEMENLKMIYKNNYLKEIEEVFGSYEGITTEKEAAEIAKQNIISDFKNKYVGVAKNDISDIAEGAGIGSPYPLGFGHGLEYWKKVDNSEEIFAEITSAELSNQASLNAIKEVFPQTYKVYQDLIEVILNAK